MVVAIHEGRSSEDTVFNRRLMHTSAMQVWWERNVKLMLD
jgi:hypothetical protein